MSKFSTYDAAGPIDAAADILMIGQGSDEKVLKLVSPTSLANAILPANIVTSTAGKIAEALVPATIARTTDLPSVVKGFGSWCAGKPAALEVVFGGIAPYAFTITTVTAKATVAATASATFTVKNGSTVVGTISFSGTTGTFALSGSATVAAGDLVTVTAPASADSTLANIAFSVRA